MATSEEILSNFMNNQNKEFVGETVDDEHNKAKENYLPETEKAKKCDTKYSAISGDEAYTTAKKAMSTAMQIPIICGGILSFIYLLITITPIIINYIRGLLIYLSTAS